MKASDPFLATIYTLGCFAMLAWMVLMAFAPLSEEEIRNEAEHRKQVARDVRLEKQYHKLFPRRENAFKDWLNAR